jgi:hypothetical protein
MGMRHHSQHRRLGHVDGALTRILVPAGLVGAVFGVIVARIIPVELSRVAFAALPALAALRLLAGRYPAEATTDRGANRARHARVAEEAPMTITTRGVRMLLTGSVLLGAVVAGTAHAGDPAASNDAAWATAIDAMDDALSKGDVGAAVTARQQAYLAALGSRRWDAMADVGDATLKLARTRSLRSVMEAEARRVYMVALFRARRQGSVHGVLRVTEAFALLGDRDVARQGLVIANALAVASSDPYARERVRALQERLAAESSLVGGVRPPAGNARGSHGGE